MVLPLLHHLLKKFSLDTGDWFKVVRCLTVGKFLDICPPSSEPLLSQIVLNPWIAFQDADVWIISCAFSFHLLQNRARDKGTCSLVSPWPELNNEPGV